jgi:transcriptional regulator with XRE-family HTH domain
LGKIFLDKFLSILYTVFEVIKMLIGQKIKQLRKELHITQDELAKKINTTKQAIYKYESGIVENIPSSKIVLLAEALQTTPAYLMGWEEDLQTHKKEDAVSDIFVRLRSDDKFLTAVQKIYSLTDEQLEAVITMLSTFQQD